MRSPENEPLVSIGITYRKGVYPYGEPRTMEQFLDCVRREHPVIVDLVRSGEVVDTNFYGSYMWEVTHNLPEPKITTANITHVAASAVPAASF
jgi:hypothetical protein